jgi:hypothetical protein
VDVPVAQLSEVETCGQTLTVGFSSAWKRKAPSSAASVIFSPLDCGDKMDDNLVNIDLEN